MHGQKKQAIELTQAIVAFKIPENVKTAVFPPFTSLHIVASELIASKIALGAQDCSNEIGGAFTGDISTLMLAEAGCKYVIVGHSERRAQHNESSELVKHKAEAAISAGLIPVICVGENIGERESGTYLQAITKQTKDSLPSLAHSSKFIIAYEPVWAIGSGKTPSLAEITEVHKTIASLLSYDTSVAKHDAVKTAIVYGGSVKPENAREILASEGVDGVLVGGASLKAEEFCKIIESAA